MVLVDMEVIEIKNIYFKKKKNTECFNNFHICKKNTSKISPPQPPYFCINENNIHNFQKIY